MLRILSLILVCYLLYKFIFDFILPALGATSRIREEVKKMQAMREEQQHQQQAHFRKEDPAVKTPAVKEEDYIDFEEVK